jgi:hypothetical protein
MRCVPGFEKRLRSRFAAAWVAVTAAVAGVAGATPPQAIWQNPAGGQWGSTTDWSIAPDFPRDTGPLYAVTLPAFSNAYTVHLDNVWPMPNVASLKVGAAATLWLSGFNRSLATTGTILIEDNARVRVTSNATVNGATIETQGNGTIEALSNGMLRDVFLNGAIQVSGDMALAGATRLGPEAKVGFGPGGRMQLERQVELNAGVVSFRGIYDSQLGIRPAFNAGEGYRFGPGFTIRADGGWGSAYLPGLLNEGAMLCDGAFSHISLSGETTAGAPLRNRGLLRASEGGRIMIFDSWDNTGGTISITNGGLYLSKLAPASAMGTFTVRSSAMEVVSTTPADIQRLRTLDISDSLITLAGSYNNVGSVFPVSDARGNRWGLAQYSFTGGRIQSDATTPLSVSGSSVLTDVTIDADLLIEPGAGVTLAGSTALDAGRTVRIGQTTRSRPAVWGATLQVASNAPFHAGTLATFESRSENITSEFILIRPTSGPTILPAGLTVRTVSASGVVRLSSSRTGLFSLINLGTIDAAAAGRLMTVNANTITNNGSFLAADRATIEAFGAPLVLGGLPYTLFTNPGLIRLDAGATLRVSGDLTQTAAGRLQIGVRPSTTSPLASVSVTGTMQVAGKLELNISPGFDPAYGQSFTFATAAGVQGTFDFDPFTDGRISSTKFLVDLYAPGNIRLIVARPGDASLDGNVNFADLLLLASHYAQPDQDWRNGDFNGDQSVGFPDLLLLAQYYGAAQADLAALAQATTPSFASEWERALANVPEPTSLLLLSLNASFLTRRRSRSRTYRARRNP